MKHNNHFLILIKACIFSLIAATASIASALPSDQKQPIYIQSDSAISDEKKGLTIYSGKVEMKQGSLSILANKVVIISKNNEVSKIVATGTPAKYEQTPSAEKQPVVAKAKRIEYSIAQDRLDLYEGASLKQEGATMLGDKISYDIAKSVVKASGNDSSQPQRIQMVIPPKAERKQ